ncbi:hypothetical protein KFE25_007510 [Diacronema lutheri]|uniref:Uncharacterized protein n=2 Tax=Diacronema lutheri TaxID=2081491 RepID=A0A8J5XV63_DIALT|nr:hypothetical protein KFE25_007510 [Diacronema lutheri]
MAPTTAYEAMIAENIRRNRAVMEALGLNRTDACKHEELRNAADGQRTSKKRASKTQAHAANLGDSGERHREAVRRSQRLADLASAAPLDACTEIDPPGARRKRAAGDIDCTGEHKAARDDHLRWAGSQRRASVVGSASYEHTLHRVMTMSEAQLSRRMNAIERACGQHAVVKMRLFASVLALEGYAHLAEEANAAHQRLVEKLGLPQGDGEEEEGEAGVDV